MQLRLSDALGAGAVVRPLDLSWQSRYQLGSALSPANVSSVLRRADYGEVGPLQDLLSEVRQKHPKLHAALQIRERGVLSLTWTVKPWQKPTWKKPRQRQVDVAKACEAMLQRLAYLPMSDEPAGGHRQALGHLLSGVYRGFAVGELIHWKAPDGKVEPWAFSAIASRRFRFVKRSKLVLDDQGAHGPDGLDLFRKYPGKFVCHRPRVSGEEPHREGLGRLLLFHICFAIWSWRDLMQYAEIFGRPWIIMKPQLDANLDPEGVDKSQTIVDTVAATQRAVLPQGYDLDVKWPDATGGKAESPSASIIDKADEAIVLGILGQQASMADVQNGLGGRGDVRDLIRQDLLESDALDLSELVTQGLFAPYVAANWGQDEPVPQYVPDLTQTQDADKFTKALERGVKVGMKIPRVWAQGQLGIPDAGPKDDVLALAPAAKAPGTPGETPDPGDDNPDSDAPDEGDSEEDDEAA